MLCRCGGVFSSYTQFIYLNKTAIHAQIVQARLYYPRKPIMSNIKAACLIIGDEVLNGKVADANSGYFAKYCFQNGIQLKEIVTVGDEEEQIVSTVQRLSQNNDFVVTTGGIGPTHDDITYECVAKSFHLPCKLDKECQRRMRAKSNPEARLNAQALTDYYRMATLPSGPNVRNYYVTEDYWVPICSINHKVYIFPGIPQLFQKLIQDFTPTLRKIYKLDAGNHQQYLRYYVKTALIESQISSFLRGLQEEATKVSNDIKIGSYPHFGMGFNTVSILGTIQHRKLLEDFVERTIKELDGEQVPPEVEEKYSNTY